MDFINWLITSSADAEKTSLALKGALTLGAAWFLHAATLACGLGLYCIGIDADFVNQAVGSITNIAYWALLIIGEFATVYGLIRKIHLRRWSASSL
jgi:hypothetical protein